MSTIQRTGTHFTYDVTEASTVTFYGSKGVLFANGETAVNTPGSNITVKGKKGSPVLPRILSWIEDDVNDGKGDKIAMVLTTPPTAVALFLEGVLTFSHLDNAIEGPDMIDIPDVLIGDRLLTIRVRENGTLSVATADSDGNLI